MTFSGKETISNVKIINLNGPEAEGCERLWCTKGSVCQFRLCSINPKSNPSLAFVNNEVL